MALLANVGLLLTLDRQSLFFGGTVVAIGCLVFFGYSFQAEKRGQAGLSIDLTTDGPRIELLGRPEKILVPLANPQTQKMLFEIAQSLIQSSQGELVLLNVIGGADPKKAFRDDKKINDALAVFERVHTGLPGPMPRIRPVVRAAKELAEGIAHAAIEERTRMIVMGWSADEEGNPSELLQKLSRLVSSDMVLLKQAECEPPTRIGVSLGGRGNLPLMVRVATALAGQYDGEVTYLNVVPENFESKHLKHARAIQIEVIGRHAALVPYRTELLVSDNPLEALVQRSAALDLLVIGSGQVHAFDRGGIGDFSSMLAQQARCSVIVSRQESSLSKLVVPQVDLVKDIVSRKH